MCSSTALTVVAVLLSCLPHHRVAFNAQQQGQLRRRLLSTGQPAAVPQKQQTAVREMAAASNRCVSTRLGPASAGSIPVLVAAIDCSYGTHVGKQQAADAGTMTNPFCITHTRYLHVLSGYAGPLPSRLNQQRQQQQPQKSRHKQQEQPRQL